MAVLCWRSAITSRGDEYGMSNQSGMGKYYLLWRVIGGKAGCAEEMSESIGMKENENCKARPARPAGLHGAGGEMRACCPHAARAGGLSVAASPDTARMASLVRRRRGVACSLVKSGRHRRSGGAMACARRRHACPALGVVIGEPGRWRAEMVASSLVFRRGRRVAACKREATVTRSGRRGGGVGHLGRRMYSSLRPWRAYT